MIIGSLSNDDGDGNENGKKSSRFQLGKKNNFARASRFFVHFFAVISPLVEDMNTRQRPSFSFSDLWCSPLEFNSKKVANIWRIERDGIRAIKFEAARTLFNWSFRSRSSRYYLSSRIFDTKELRGWDNQNFETGTPMTYAGFRKSLFWQSVCISTGTITCKNYSFKFSDCTFCSL